MAMFAAAMLAALYFLAGLVVGFVLLAEFPLGVFVFVQIALLVLAVIALTAALRRWPVLETSSVFVAAAIGISFVSDLSIVGLPECAGGSPGLACLADARDVRIEFALDLVVLAIALAGIVAVAARGARGLVRQARS